MAKKTDYIDFKGLIDNYIKHWWWFAISIVLCVAIGFCCTRKFPQKVGVRASVVISPDNSTNFASMSGIADLFGSSADVEDEVFVINSHTVLRNVARDLGTYRIHLVKQGFLKSKFSYPEYPVEVYADPAVADTLMTTILFKTKIYKDGTADVTAKVDRDEIADVEKQKLPVTLNTIYGRFVIDKTKYFPKNQKDDLKSVIYFSGYDVAAEGLAEEIDVDKASKKSNVVSLFIKTNNSNYGRDVLNEIVKKYNERTVTEATIQGEKTAAFLDERLALISGDLATAESDIQTYKQNQGIVDVTTEAAYNLQLKSTAETALVTAQTNSEVIKMTRDFLTQPQNAYEIVPVTSEIPQAVATVSTYNELILRRLELKQNAKSDNRQLKQLEEQIDALRKSLNATLESAYQTSLVAIRDAKAEANKAQGKLGNIPTQEREFLNLKRQQEVKQQLYLFLLQRREETAMVIANAVPKGSVVDDAYQLSDPIGMGKKMMLLIAFMMGLFIPVVLLYLKDLLRNKFETRKELEKITDLPILGEICADNSGRNLVVTSQDTSSTSELFRLVRSSLQFMLNGANDKVVIVTSTRSGEGKSFISLNLAASLALLGKKVLLVGMDIRNPRLGEYLGISNRLGLTVYLSQQGVDINSLVNHYADAPGLDVILGGPIPPNPGELLTSKKVDDLFAEMRERYDYIIVDSAPVGLVSDSFNLARVADATIYVCRVNYTTTADINYAADISNDNRLPKLSLVVNGTKTTRGYGYGYGRSNTKN